MKTNQFKTILAAMLCVAVAACTDNPIEPDNPKDPEQETPENPEQPENPGENPEVPAATFSVSALLEADGLKTVWAEGDEIAIIDGTAEAKYLLLGADAVTEGAALFTDADEAVSKDASEYVVIYPSIVADPEGSLKINVPVEQVIVEGANCTMAAYAAVGKVQEGAAQLKNVCALVKVTVSASGINKVLLRSKNREIIAGDATVNASDATVTSVENGLSEIALVTESGGEIPVGDYYIAALPGSLEGGYEIILSRSTDNLKSFKADAAELTLGRNGISDMGDITSEYTYEWVNIISSKAELDAFNLVMAETTETWVLTEDISYEGGFWTGKNFAGVFDGAGHRIYNIKVAVEAENGGAGFMLVVTGTVKDLVYGSKNGTAWDEVSTITYKGTGTGSNDYIGLLARLNSGADVSGITNFANITIDAATTRTVRVGGLTGLAFKGEDPAPVIKNCTNYGNIENNAVGTADSNSCMAGVVAVWESNGVAMDGLVNYGNIINKGANCRFVGGVCACVSRNIWVQNCKNYGEVKDCITAADRLLTIGGVLGIYDADNGQMKNCENYGDVSTVRPQSNRAGGIAGTIRLNHIYDCRNEGDVTVKVDGVTNQFSGAGGVIGFFDRTSGPQKLYRCTNTGMVSISGNMTGNVGAGGIIGICQNTELKENVNSGAVSATGKADVYAGGICGWNFQTAFADMDNNQNSGAVSAVMGTTGKLVCAGGVFGYMGKTSPIKNSGNTGVISTTGEGTFAGSILGNGVGSTISGCKVQGTVNGTELTADNFGGYIFGSNNNVEATDCYFTK